MIAVETKLHPLVLAVYPPGGFPEAEQRAMLDVLAGVCRKAQREGNRLVSIAYGGTDMSPRDRQTLSRLMRGFPQDLLDVYLASYVVVESQVARGIVTALRWLSPQLDMIDPVPSVEVAITGAEVAFREAGIAVDPAVFREGRRWLVDQHARQRDGAAAT